MISEEFKKNILPKEFYYQRKPHAVSKGLLGKYLIRLDPFPIGGKIVETETYPGNGDIPSHHHNQNITERTKVIFEEEKGLMYVYMIYGLHYCFSVTSGAGETNHSVSLIRALKPKFGIEEMKKRRAVSNLKNLLSGPAKLTQALNITKENYGWNLRKSNIIICDLDNLNNFGTEINSNKFAIEKDTRIGIDNYGRDHSRKKWRFYIKDSRWTSK